VASAGTASAQSINIDLSTTFGTPSNTFAAAGLAGTWNPIQIATGPFPLVDLAGAMTAATISRTAGVGYDFSYNNAGTFGDDEALMDDGQDPSSDSTWTIANLAAGNYTVYTYAWAPDSATYVSNVVVNGGTATPVGGAWPSGYVAGITHSVDNVAIAAGGSITIRIYVNTSFATFDGVQIVLGGSSTPSTPFCFGNGTGTACPCGNSGAAGNGCANSVNASGAHLAGSGTASVMADTYLLSGSGMPNSSALYFQATAQINGGAGIVFGDGLRCGSTNVLRLGTKSNVGGASHYPDTGDTSISIRGLIPAGGGTRYYQCWYRNADPTFCNPETFNLSNGVGVTWIP